MDAMRDALLKRKNAVQHGFKISIELEPADDKEKEKKLGLAPSVKDAKSPQEPKLVPEVEVEAMGPEEVSHEQEAANDTPVFEKGEDMGALGLPELPIGREPKGLHEKAAQNMMNQRAKHKLKK